MAPRKQPKKKAQYYTIVFEKYLEVMEEVNKMYFLLSDKIKDLSQEISVNDWTESQLPDIMETFCHVNSYRIFLEEKINNPSEQEIKFTTEHNIKDVIFDEQELKAMQNFYLEMQARKHELYKNYSFSTEIN